MLRVVAYKLDGNKIASLRGLEVKWYSKFGDIPTLAVSHSELQEQPAALTGEVEVAVEYFDGTTWIEPSDGRFVVQDDGFERLDDGSRTHQINLIGLVSRLRKARLVKGSDALDSSNKRVFSGVTPGSILATAMSEAKGRGAFPGISYDFSASTDSAGKSWPATVTRRYDLGTSVYDMLQDLFNAQLVEYRMDGRVLHVYATGNGTVDWTTTTPPVYLRDLGVANSPEKTTYTDLVTHVTVFGDGGASWTIANSNAGTLDRREITVQAGGCQDQTTAQQVAAQYLKPGAAPGQQYNREWTAGMPGAFYTAGVSFRVGDWVYVDTAVSPKQRMRVADVSLRAKGAGPVTSFATLGLIRKDNIELLARNQRGLEGGSGPVASIGSSVPSSGGYGTLDSTPTTGSTNPVSSGGVRSALDGKQDKLTFDTTPTLNSSNPVTSDGIKRALNALESQIPPPVNLSKLSEDQLVKLGLKWELPSLSSIAQTYCVATLDRFDSHNPVFKVTMDLDSSGSWKGISDGAILVYLFAFPKPLTVGGTTIYAPNTIVPGSGVISSGGYANSGVTSSFSCDFGQDHNSGFKFSSVKSPVFSVELPWGSAASSAWVLPTGFCAKAAGGGLYYSCEMTYVSSPMATSGSVK